MVSKKWKTKCGKKVVKHGAKGYNIGQPGTAKWRSYCSRSGGIAKKFPAAREPCSPNMLSRKKWRCGSVGLTVLLLMLVSVVLLSGVSAGDWNPIANSTFNQLITGAQDTSVAEGVQLNVERTFTLGAVYIPIVASGPNTLLLSNASFDLINSSTIVNGRANFSNVLTAGKTYYLRVTNTTGASWTIPHLVSTFVAYNDTANGIYWANAIYDTSIANNRVRAIQTIITLNSNVILNSPANGYVSPSTPITLNATPTVVGGATLRNMTLFTNVSGTFRLNQTITYGGSITTNTSTFTKSFPDGNYLWGVRACDSDGACGWSENRTVTIDTTSPSGTIFYPTTTLTSLTNGQNVTLNFSITDTNRASCWKEYNNVNTTISCTTNNSFIYVAGVNTIKVWANDTAGNRGVATRTWDNLITGNDVVYSATAVATATESFIYVGTKDPSITSISAVLWYKGSSYTSTVVSSGNLFNLTNSIEIPAGATTNGFYWTLTAINSSGSTFVINSSNYSQVVGSLNLGACSSPSLDGLTLNFTIYDTTTGLPINASFEGSFDYYAAGGSGSTSETYSFQDLSENRSNFMFCLNSSGRNATLDAFINYYSTGYDLRNYILDNAIIGNFTQNIPLYLTETTLTDVVTITVQDQNYDALGGALVTIQKWNVGTNSYSTIGMFTTSDGGTGIMDLQLYNTWYRAIITYGGEVVKVTDIQKLSSTSWGIIVELGVSNPYDLFGTISHGLTYDNSTNIVTFSWGDSSGYVNEACLYVKNSTGLGYVAIYGSCITTVAGSINYQLSGNGTYIVYGQINLGADYDNVTQITDSMTISIGTPALNARVAPFGKVLALIVIGTLGLIGVASGSPIFGLLLIGIGIFTIDKLGWVLGVGSILWGIIEVILIIIFRQNRRNG